MLEKKLKISTPLLISWVTFNPVEAPAVVTVIDELAAFELEVPAKLASAWSFAISSSTGRTASARRNGRTSGKSEASIDGTAVRTVIPIS